MSGSEAAHPPPPPGLRKSSSSSQKRLSRKSSLSDNGTVTPFSSKPPSPPHQIGERTVKKLRLSKALTIPEGTTVSEACRRMASRRVNAVLLTDSNALLSGIVTDKDVAVRVIAEGLKPEQTVVSKIMTRNPIFVTVDSLALEALQKMIQGKFRHLPVVDNGEVIALLDITKCLYDAITKMEKAAEQGSAIAAAVEGVERQMGNNAPSTFIETLRERLFKPLLSTIIGEQTKVAIASPSDTVYVAARKMRELRVNSAVVGSGNKIQGILTSKDILMRVVAQNLSAESTVVEKVMTPSPECISLDATILDALHLMHNGKYLHLPVMDKDGSAVACVDVLQITHAAISMVENSAGAINEVANTVMQKFWDSTLPLEAPEDYETQSEKSTLTQMTDVLDPRKHNSVTPASGNSFTFKFEDLNGRVHRINSGTENLKEILAAVMQRLGVSNHYRPHLLYKDEEGDKVLLATDDDLIGAINHVRSSGSKVLRLYLDFNGVRQEVRLDRPQLATTTAQTGLDTTRYCVLSGAFALAGVGLIVYLQQYRS